MRRIITILMAIFLLIFIGCAITPMYCPREGSAICEVSEKTGIAVDDIAMFFIGVNIANIKRDVYTAQEAMKFVESILEDIDRFEASPEVYTWADAYRYIMGKYGEMSPDARLGFYLLQSRVNLGDLQVQNPMSSADYDIARQFFLEVEMTISFYL